jgi:hypothetical protein
MGSSGDGCSSVNVMSGPDAKWPLRALFIDSFTIYFDTERTQNQHRVNFRSHT